MIVTRRLSFAHHGREPCVRECDLAVDAGDALVLASASGSGKSTLLRLMAGLIPRVQGGRISGHVLLDGRPPSAIAPRELPRLVGYVPQDPETAFVARSVECELASILENVGEPRARARIDEVLAELGAEALASRETQTLSGGEAARVALAAALVAGPALLLLDEPTAQLDEAARAELVGTLRALRAGGLAMVIATHDPRGLASVATRTLDRGTTSTTAPRAMPQPRDAPALVEVDRAVHRHAGDGGVGPIDLDVRPGEVVALVGSNGCGKTTLLHLVAGLLPCQVGRVWIGGEGPAALSPVHLASRVGLAFQHPAWHITQDTVADEVAFTSRALGRREDSGILGALGLAHLSRAHPWDLSGGERERLAIATAAAHDPPVLLLDEPTRGLDGDGLARVAALLHERCTRGRATIVATHQPSVQALAHRVVTLERGLLVAERRPSLEVAA